MNPWTAVVVFSGLVLVVPIIVRHYFTGATRLNREVRDVARSTLAELPEGTPGRIVGRAESIDDTLEAPLTGRKCLYYTAIVEVSDGNNWREIIREDRAVMFTIDDGSARAIVDPRESKVALTFDGNSDSGTFDNPTEREQAFLDAHETSSKRGKFNRNLRYREAVIAPGKTIAIVGAAVREPDPAGQPDAAYRGDAPTKLRMTSSRKYPMMISDSSEATR